MEQHARILEITQRDQSGKMASGRQNEGFWDINILE